MQFCTSCLNRIYVLFFKNGVNELTDEEVKQLVDGKHIPAYRLEGVLGDYERGVAIRRQIVIDKLASEEALDKLPYSNYEYLYVSIKPLQKNFGIKQ